MHTSESRASIVVLTFALLLTFCACGLWAGDKSGNKKKPPAAPSAPRVRALIIGGMPGTPIHARRFADWLERFHDYLVKSAKMKPEDITLLSSEPNVGKGIVDGTADEKTIPAAIAKLAAEAAPQDQVIILFIGHGTNIDGVAKIALPGPDVSFDDLAPIMAKIKAKNQVVLNFTPASGDSVKGLAAANRVLITATSPTETAEPIFMEFFMQALEGKDADADKNGKTDMLEAFNWASIETSYFIRRIYGAEDGWRVIGRKSVALFKKLYASQTDEPGSRKLSKSSNANVDDPIPSLVTDPKGKDKVPGHRMIAQHAILEDAGAEVGVAAVRAGQYQPLDGRKDKEPGAFARRILLGVTTILPPAPPAPPAKPAAKPKPAAEKKPDAKKPEAGKKPQGKK